MALRVDNPYICNMQVVSMTESSIRTEIASKIRAARAYARMSQAELADALGWGHNAFWRIETTGQISASKLVLLAAALGCSPASLLPGDGPMLKGKARQAP